MIGILLITHDDSGEALARSASHVLGGRPPQFGHLGVTAEEAPSAAAARAAALLRTLDSGDGVLVLTDIFGATPANIATKLLQPGRVEGIAGLNLPMLLRALTYRDRDMATLVAKAVAGGRDGVLAMEP